MGGDKEAFTGAGFSEAELAPVERAQFREMRRSVGETFEQIKSATTIINAIIIIGRIVAFAAPVGAAIGFFWAMKGG